MTDLAASRAEAHWATWRPSAPYSIGLEEEVMLLDPLTHALTPAADGLLSSLSPELVGHCWAETHAGAVELTSSPHATLGAAVTELRRLRVRLAEDAERLGLAVASAGMPPSTIADGEPVAA